MTRVKSSASVASYMSEEKKSDAPASAIDGFVLVKGGTSSSGYDNEMAARRADAEARRDKQGRMAEIGARGVRPGEAARFGSARFMNEASPRVVLLYLNKDKTVRQECISEITMIEGKAQGELDMMFTLVCPRCVARGVPQGEAQCMVRSSHHKFYIDDKSKGQPVMVRDPFTGEPVAVRICGTICCDDTIKCDAYNCDWAVRIWDSCVQEA